MGNVSSSATEVEEIYTAAGVRVDPEIGQGRPIWTTALIVLALPQRASSALSITAAKAVYGYDQRVGDSGSKGKNCHGKNFLSEPELSSVPAIQYTKDLPLNFFMDRYTESFVAELPILYCSRAPRKRTTAVTGIDGRISRGDGALRRASRTMSIGAPLRLSEVGGMRRSKLVSILTDVASLGARRCIDSGIFLLMSLRWNS